MRSLCGRWRLKSILNFWQGNDRKPRSGTGLFSKMVGFISSIRTSESESLNQLNIDAAALDSLNEQLYLDINDMHVLHSRLQRSRTFKGRYRNALSYILSAYCCYKVVMCAVNLLLRRVGRTDPVTRLAEVAVTYFGWDFDVKFWSQQLSFLFVGVIIVASVRGMLMRLTKVSRVFGTPTRLTLSRYFTSLQAVHHPTLLFYS